MEIRRHHARTILGTVSLVVIPACSQGTLNRSAVDILSSVVLAGGSVIGHGGGSSAEPKAPPAAAKVVSTAEQYIGVPYRWGGSTPKEGFDCSGYVRYVYEQQGVKLPRTSREQARVGQGVVLRGDVLRAGDLVMFAESGESISHVAIYAGKGWIIHSSSSGNGVRYDDLEGRRGAWFAQHMVAARRLAVDGRSMVQSLGFASTGPIAFDPPDHAPAPR